MKLKPWIKVGSAYNDTGEYYVQVYALKASGGFFVAISRSAFYKSTFMGERSYSSFIPVQTLEELRDIFFEGEEDQKES